MNPYKMWIGEDESFCDKCNGYGYLIMKGTAVGITTGNNKVNCIDCKGTGKLDWCRRLVLGIR